MDAIIIRQINLPLSVPGVTIKDENDDYNVYINARLSDEGRIRALRHEIDHIKDKHFNNDKSINEKENRAKSAENRKEPLERETAFTQVLF